MIKTLTIVLAAYGLLWVILNVSYLPSNERSRLDLLRQLNGEGVEEEKS